MKKIWGTLMMLVLVVGAVFAFASCGDDDEDNGSSIVSGGTTNGGGASASSIVGKYTAITNSDHEVSVIFANDGSGTVIEKYKNKYSGAGNWENDQYEFTYSMAGETGILRKAGNSYSGGKSYTLKFVDGFLLIEESDGDVEYILFKEGQDLGKPNNGRFVGTWGFSSNDEYGEDLEVTFNSNGTGTGTSEYKSGSYSEKASLSFTFSAKNAYIAECNVKTVSEYDEYEDSYLVVLLGGKLYLVEADGEVDYEEILSKR